MSALDRSVVVVAAAVACATLALAGAELGTRTDAATSVPTHAALLARGTELYGRYCATCHGATGRGDGEAAYLLSPAPRDFSTGKFRFTTTANAVPSDADLLRTLELGMQGSSMPAWEWLPLADRSALVTAVRELALEGKAARMVEKARIDEEELTLDEARDIARKQLTPGAELPAPAPVANVDVAIAQGRRLFLAQCAKCHGRDGRGGAAADQWNEDGTPAYPRDFARGALKGGNDAYSISCRVRLGLPGSPMPATSSTDPADVGALVAYVQSLLPSRDIEPTRMTRRVLHAQRVRGPLPTDPVDPAWKAIAPTRLPLMTLWARAEHAEGVLVRAVHDGERLALALSWEDSTRDEVLLGQQSFGDAVALQLSADAAPPLFTMGSAEQPVVLWQWKAAWQSEAQAARSLDAYFPHRLQDMQPHLPPALAATDWGARAVGNTQAAPSHPQPVEELVARGIGTLGPPAANAPPSSLRGSGRWVDEGWDVVFVRELRAEGGPELVPGKSIRVAFAVWDGAARERNGQKSVSVWHECTLDP